MRKKYYKILTYFSKKKKLFIFLIGFSYERIMYQYLQMFLIYKKLFQLIYPTLHMVLIEHKKPFNGYI
jgi:hypothetical protein